MAPRQALGLLLAFCILLGGRWLRTRLLIGPDGRWQEPLWLDAAVLVPEAVGAPAGDRKPVLTAPLPINTCSQDSLTLLPGVGPKLAARIAAVRESGFRFGCAADLMTVKGIGKVLSARLETLVVFDGAPDTTLRRTAGDFCEGSENSP